MSAFAPATRRCTPGGNDAHSVSKSWDYLQIGKTNAFENPQTLREQGVKMAGKLLIWTGGDANVATKGARKEPTPDVLSSHVLTKELAL